LKEELKVELSNKWFIVTHKRGKGLTGVWIQEWGGAMID